MNDLVRAPEIDVDACAAEPIRIPGGIQPHGALAVLNPDSLEILQASANLGDVVGTALAAGDNLSDFPGADEHLRTALLAWSRGVEPVFLRTVELSGHPLQLVGHRSRQGLILEFEEPPTSRGDTLEALYPRLLEFLNSLGSRSETVEDIAQAAVDEVKTLTGFNRILLYSFDAKGDGTVLAEATDGVLPSYLDLRFPAADIPPQARELYKLNRLRLIPTSDYTPVPIAPALSPIDGQPLDLSFAGLRSVSPVHLEYMRNMGTGSSMSISILIDGELWGLISGHSAAPHRVNAQVRTACDFLGQIVSLQIGARERSTRAARRLEGKRKETELLARLARAPNFQEGLIDSADLWRGLTNAGGAAILTEGQVLTVGDTPSEAEIRHIAEWLRRQNASHFATESLAKLWPAAEAFAASASGLLAVSISQLHSDYLMWFRPEVVRSVSWSGDPTKPMQSGAERLHPRKSFEAWKELVRFHSLPWDPSEAEEAQDFRNAIVDFVLRRAEERAALSGELQRSNKELESFSYSISHDLRAPFRHIVGYAELLSDREKTLDSKSLHYLKSIVDAALSAGRLVDDLLAFSQLGRANLSKTAVDMRKLAQEVKRALEPDVAGRAVEWRVGELPPAWGDGALLRQVIFNLVENALKYSRPRDKAVITVEGWEESQATVYRVTDNGVGFDMAYVGKLFGVFQRLHRTEDFEGTGIGLALAKRVVERHGGEIEAQGELDVGASFTVRIPRREHAKTTGVELNG